MCVYWWGRGVFKSKPWAKAVFLNLGVTLESPGASRNFDTQTAHQVNYIRCFSESEPEHLYSLNFLGWPRCAAEGGEPLGSRSPLRTLIIAPCQCVRPGCVWSETTVCDHCIDQYRLGYAAVTKKLQNFCGSMQQPLIFGSQKSCRDSANLQDHVFPAVTWWFRSLSSCSFAISMCGFLANGCGIFLFTIYWSQGVP